MLYRNQIDYLLTGEGFVLETSATPEPTILVREDAFPIETTRRRKSTGADDLSMFFRGALIQKKTVATGYSPRTERWSTKPWLLCKSRL